jgi:hypothetical protein
MKIVTTYNYRKQKKTLKNQQYDNPAKQKTSCLLMKIYFNLKTTILIFAALNRYT